MLHSLLASLQHVRNCRVSFDDDAVAAVNNQTRVPHPTELSYAEPPVLKAFPPPTQADVSDMSLNF